MRGGLAGNDAGRRYYNERVMAHRLLVGREAGEPSGFESERMLSGLLDGATQERSTDQIFWTRFASILAGAAALFIFAVNPPDHGASVVDGMPPGPMAGAQGEYLGARGVQAAEQPAGLGIEGVPVAGGMGYEVVASDGVWIRDFLRLSYRNTDERLKYLFVFAMQDKGETLWYLPLPEEEQSALIRRGRDTLFEIKLIDGHRAGVLRIFAVFSQEPIDFERMRSLVAHDLGYMSDDVSQVRGALSRALKLDPRVEVVNVQDTVVLRDGIRAGK